jgi:hypothetical protein
VGDVLAGAADLRLDQPCMVVAVVEGVAAQVLAPGDAAEDVELCELSSAVSSPKPSKAEHGAWRA